MAIRTLATLCTLLLTAGCMSVRSVDSGGGEAAYEQFNRGVRGKVARVTLEDGRRFQVVGARVVEDSLTWVDRSRNVVERVALGEVDEVSVVKAGSGALRGLIVGAVAGAAFGGIRAAVEGDDPATDPLAATKEEKYRIYPAAHAAYAVLASTPLGAVIGTRRIYRFQPNPIAAER